MQKEKYINPTSYKRKKLGIIVAILMLALFVLLLILQYVVNENRRREQLMATGNFSSIEEILEYYGCQFLKIKNSTETDFSVDIYTKFKYDLYEGEKSNEEFYQNVIHGIAKFLNYTNFRIFDADKDKQEKIEIQVIGDGNKIKTIYINGREDYFIYKDSQINLSKYKEMEITELSIQAPELINCIQNGWSIETNFGTRETIFQDYYVYFDEGIKTRKISGKLYNIIFTKNYVKPIVNGFTVGEKRDIIERELGNPMFKNEDESIIGYKSKDVYIFFGKDEISVYRNIAEEGFDEFFKLVDQLLEDECTLLEFMNELTYIWPDYEEYTYNSETVFLSYPNKGIDIKTNYDNTNGIVVYNNIGVSQETIHPYFQYTEFIANLQVDNVYNAEVRRVKEEAQFFDNCEEYKTQYETEDDRNRGKIYDYYMKMSSNGSIICTYFISQNPQFPNCELSENISSYIWLNEYCFLYSIAGKGIYYYDLKSQVKGVIVTGSENFAIKSYEDGILKYDNRELEVKY